MDIEIQFVKTEKKVFLENKEYRMTHFLPYKINKRKDGLIESTPQGKHLLDEICFCEPDLTETNEGYVVVHQVEQ